MQRSPPARPGGNLAAHIARADAHTAVDHPDQDARGLGAIERLAAVTPAELAA
ncbi:hypothetical protein OHS71_08535 [Streptomyces sp. NBC_00377]|uniref:hypothetical protein n=1 Tax=unclassified Streptomyces TaxID=2593676 RepID=UPI002E1BD675|nr:MULTISPECIES: hypothetical protein [unclassified Streptomyces]